MLKRLFDVTLAAVALLLLSPVLLGVALVLLADSGRPVFFRQTRVGRGDLTFEILKFRTMVNGAAQIGPYFTQTNDARITRIGQWLRRTSVDELPQLINVLRGDMSLVGPRPDLPVQRSLYSAVDWQARCSVRPGITGLSQATLRSQATVEQRLALDLRSVRTHSFVLDLKIIVWTLRRLSGKGAN